MPRQGNPSASHGHTKPSPLSPQRKAAADALLDGRAKNRVEACDIAGIPIGKARKTRWNRASLVFKEPAVVEYMAKVQAAATERAEITQERVLRELAAVGFSRVTDFMRILEGGEPAVDLSNLDDMQKAALAEITVEDFTDGRGEDSRDVRRVKFKLHDKLSALDKIARLKQWYVEKHELAGPGGAPIQFVSGFGPPSAKDD